MWNLHKKVKRVVYVREKVSVLLHSPRFGNTLKAHALGWPSLGKMHSYRNLP
jgi:hypothetical protein